MKNIVILLFITVIPLAFFSCEQKTEDTPVNAATIDISSPIENAEFGFAEPISIKATVTAEQELHGYKIEITKACATLYEKEAHIHGESLNIDEEWQNDVEDGGNLAITIIVAVDHHGNTDTGSVNIICHPK